MAGISTAWKGDNYKFVGKAFDFAYADRMNKLLPVLGEVNSKSIDYAIAGTGGFGELAPYDGTNLVLGSQKRGFKTIITPEEFSLSVQVPYKAAKVDKSGETKRVGSRLGDAASMTVYLHALRMFAHAFDPKYVGGDGKPWAAADHPVASMRDENRRYIPDPDSGSYSNLISEKLSVEALTKAQSAANRFVTPDGLPFLSDFDTVLVSPELEPVAKKLFGENSKLRPVRNPNDNSNAANPVYDMGYIVIGGGRDGFSENQWAVCDRRLMKQMVNLVYITRPEVVQTELDNPLIDQFTAYADFGTGWGDSRQIIFSNGGK